MDKKANAYIDARVYWCSSYDILSSIMPQNYIFDYVFRVNLEAVCGSWHVSVHQLPAGRGSDMTSEWPWSTHGHLKHHCTIILLKYLCVIEYMYLYMWEYIYIYIYIFTLWCLKMYGNHINHIHRQLTVLMVMFFDMNKLLYIHNLSDFPTGLQGHNYQWWCLDMHGDSQDVCHLLYIYM